MPYNPALTRLDRRLLPLFVVALLAVCTPLRPVSAQVVTIENKTPLPIDSELRTRTIQEALKILEDNYVFPEVAQKMGKAIRERLENKEYDQVTTGQDLAAKLTSHLQEVSKDKHLRVRCSAEKLPQRAGPGKPSPKEIEQFKAAQKMINAGFQKVERLPGNVGYLDLRGFVEGNTTADTAAAAMNFLANTNALIIDLRRNGGGSPKTVALVCSYFFDEDPVHLNSLYWRKGDRTEEFWTLKTVAGKRYLNRDVFILTSNRTFSGAEEFAYNLQNLKRATIVGETTGGGAHPGGGYPIGEHFMMFVPTGRAINPITKTNWEGTGVKPDIAVPADKALETAHKEAIKRLLANAKGDDARRQIERDLERSKEQDQGKKQGPTPAAGKGGQRPATVQEALAFFRKQDWPRTAQAYEKLVKTNLHDGQHWNNYGYALHMLKRYGEAIKATQKAVELGFRPEIGLYNIACGHALLGHKEEAIAYLGKAMDAGFSQDETLRTDSDIDSIRDDPRVKKLLGVPPDGLTREERWQYDLDYLARRMEKVHYNLYAKVKREKLQAAFTDLKSKIGSLKDEEIVVGIQRILAMVGDGHTTLMGNQLKASKTPLRYPVELYLYKEGLHVRGAAPEYAEIVGGKVLQIGNASAEEALVAVEPLCSRDNAMGVKLRGPHLLENANVLSYLKLTDDMTGVNLVVRKADSKEIKIALKPVPGSHVAKSFVFANAGTKTPEPLAFKKNEDKFWFEHLPEKKLVYFQFNQVGNKPDETLEKLCGRLFTFINDNPVEYLVIDMRNNSGGNNFLNQPLVHGLIRCDKINRPGHLFVLTGRRTFSAAMNGAVDIERNTHAIFVGEPTGSSPNFVGETNILVLPCSELRPSCSSLYWQSSTATDRRTWIAPSLVAEPSIAAFAQNRDPGLEAIFEYIDAEPTAK